MVVAKMFKKAKNQPSSYRQRPAIVKPPTTFSYYAGEKTDNLELRSRKIAKTKAISKISKLPKLLLGGVILLSIVFSTTLSTSPLVRFSSQNRPYRADADYQSIINTTLSRHWQNNFKIGFNTSTAEAEIKQALPEVSTINFGLPIIGRRPTISLGLRQPVLQLTTASNVFVVDKFGVAIVPANNLLSSSLESLPKVQDKSGLKVVAGGQVLTAETVSFITGFVGQLKAKQLAVETISLQPNGYEVDFKLKDIPFILKTDSAGDARLQAGAFLAARDNNIRPGEYMDLRVEEKLFYK